MAARSSSSSDSDYASNATNGKLVALDSLYHGPSEVMKVGVKKRAREPERSMKAGVEKKAREAERSFVGQHTGVKKRAREAERSFVGQHNDSQKDKGKGIISRTGGFHDELTGGKVVATKNLEAENRHMAVNSNIQNKSPSETQRIEMDAVGECRCCFWDYRLENMVECPNRHQFCFDCLRRRVEEIIYGGSKAHASLSCMEIDGCLESIPFSEIQRALPHDVIEKYEARQADNAIVEAKIEGMVYCPFCNIPYEADKCVQVLDCQNLKCLKASCIQCKKLSHLPLRCEKGEEKSDSSLRREVEERMTKAVIRECNKCKAELIKTDGCNRVTCRCGTTMCYVCRKTILLFDFTHFCLCFRDNAEPGKPCQICNKCKVNENEAEDNEALAAKEEALNEFVGKERPELLDQEIGPPLKRVKRQHESTQQQRHQGHHRQRHQGHHRQRHHGHHRQRFPPNRIVPPQEFFRPRIDQLQMVAIPHFFRPVIHQLENVAMPHFFRPGIDQLPRPVRFFGFGDQLPNTAVPAPPHIFRNMAVHAVSPSPQGFFRLGDQLGNTVVPPRLPAPPHFFIFNGGHQLQNTAVPQQLLAPPHFVRFDYGHQLQNMAIRPPMGFFRFGDQLPN